MAEQSVRRVLLISQGAFTDLITRPLSAVIAMPTVALVIWPLLKDLRHRLMRLS